MVQVYITITTYGTKLNNKYGITSKITGWFTYRQICKNQLNAKKRGDRIIITRSKPPV